MNKRYFSGGLIWVVISSFVCILSTRLGIGTFRSPGPGFFPFWSGIVLGAFGIIHIIKDVLKKRGKIKRTKLWEGPGLRRVILILASLMVYAILLKRVGYLITTFGLMTFLFSTAEGLKRRLWIPILSAAIVLVTYFIFCVWLKIPLPKGVLIF